MAKTRLGIDIGGTGTKGGIVDLDNGELVSDRVRVRTPDPATPESVVAAVAQLVGEFGYRGPIGVGFPAVVVDGVVLTANNIDQGWIGVDATSLLEGATGCQVEMVNDADAVALCEARYGAARDVGGVVLVVTFGTGIGGALLNDGRLVPNLQIGDIELDGHNPCEEHFSAAAKTSEDLGWEEWGSRANRFLSHVKTIFSPRLIVVGGGVTKNWDDWSGYLSADLGAVPASRINNAGIVGAATLVEDR
jgi:polyphosphate glucokinase